MGFLKKEKRTAVSVQTQGGYPPVLPVTAGERALYRALREQVPIIHRRGNLQAGASYRRV